MIHRWAQINMEPLGWTTHVMPVGGNTCRPKSTIVDDTNFPGKVHQVDTHNETWIKLCELYDKIFSSNT